MCRWHRRCSVDKTSGLNDVWRQGLSLGPFCEERVVVVMIIADLKIKSDTILFTYVCVHSGAGNGSLYSGRRHAFQVRAVLLIEDASHRH